MTALLGYLFDRVGPIAPAAHNLGDLPLQDLLVLDSELTPEVVVMKTATGDGINDIEPGLVAAGVTAVSNCFRHLSECTREDRYASLRWYA